MKPQKDKTPAPSPLGPALPPAGQGGWAEPTPGTALRQPIFSPEVSVIPATKRSVQAGGQFKAWKELRVAAYCRVSTGDESQQTSYTNQRAFYFSIIHSRPGWQFAGIYADEARSGTNRFHRKEFNRMMEDAKSGKIDYIMTKSISRFARNTLDTLDCVRQLRQLSPPVGIVFEKENIDTLNATGELILTILAALAQDESRSLSDNIRWTFQKNFQSGKPQINLNRMIGYDKSESGAWIINENQAQVVRFIFERYLRGFSARSIAKMANQAGMRTVNGNLWRADAVLVVLRNEKYVGDLEMQKTVTKDFLTHKSIANKGEAPKYYVKDHHAAIIDRCTWERAQRMLGQGKAAAGKDQKAAKRGTRASPFGNLLCGEKLPGPNGASHECGRPFFRMTYSGVATRYRDERSEGLDPRTESESYSFQYPVWRCEGRRGKAKGAPPSKARRERCTCAVLQECALEQSFMELLYTLKREQLAKGERSGLALAFEKAYADANRRSGGNCGSLQRAALLDDQIKDLEQQLQRAISCQKKSSAEIAGKGPEHLSPGPAEGGAKGAAAGEDYPGGHADDGAGLPPAVDGKDGACMEDTIEPLRSLLAERRRERTMLDTEQEMAAAMKRSYELFLQCLKELPEKNPAGMPMKINGLDVDGGVLRDYHGKARTGSVRRTPDWIEQAPDYLHFERGIYTVFIQSGRVCGDVVEYLTTFGVRLSSTGNRRTLGSFLGFRRCREDGTIELLDETWKVNNKTITYRRKKLHRAKKDAGDTALEKSKPKK